MKRFYFLVVLSVVFLFSGVFICLAVNPGDPETLMQLDRDFDKATHEKGVEGWVVYFAPNGAMVRGDSVTITGHKAIREAMEGAFKDPNYSLRWQPTKGDILIPGVLGYTVGRYENKRKNKEGKMVVAKGTYTSVWKKQADGSWKIVLDTGNQDGPPAVVN
jgi:ketosteroid isomerase-like protein